jgi:hypothetical protein
MKRFLAGFEAIFVRCLAAVHPRPTAPVLATVKGRWHKKIPTNEGRAFGELR